MNNIGVYLDCGQSFGSSYGAFCVPTKPFNTNLMNTYLNSLFTQMKSVGQSDVYLAFAQLDNLETYLSGDFSNPSNTTTDVIAELLNKLLVCPMPNSDNFLKYDSFDLILNLVP